MTDHGLVYARKVAAQHLGDRGRVTEKELKTKRVDLLKAEGIGITVVDAYSIKPLAKDVIRAAAQKTNNTVLTVEDHYPEGGLGDAVAGELSADGVRVHKLAVTEIPRSGKAEELMAKYGIDAAAIVNKVKALG